MAIFVGMASSSTVSVTVRVIRSITLTPPPLLVTYAVVPEGLMTMLPGVLPMAMRFPKGRLVCVLTVRIDPVPPLPSNSTT